MNTTGVMVLFLLGTTVGVAEGAPIDECRPVVARAALTPAKTDQVSDRSGATLRWRRVEGGTQIIELTSPALTIQKQMKPTGSCTAVWSGTDVVMLGADLHGVVVSTRDRTLRASQLQISAFRRLVDQAGQLPLLRSARALLNSIELRPDRPVDAAMLLTRLLIDALTGGPSVGANRAQLYRTLPAEGVAAGVACDAGSESGCWAIYSATATAIAEDLEECLRDVSWWNFLAQDLCGVVYLMRSEAALFRYFECIAGVAG